MKFANGVVGGKGKVKRTTRINKKQKEKIRNHALRCN
jgi:hypothetical protein